MPFQIIRNDITKVKADAIVNTANPEVAIGDGVEFAIYKAAGREKLLAEREKIGRLVPGEVGITDAFALQAKYIIHVSSPWWTGGSRGEEKLLRECYDKVLLLAYEHGCASVAFPLLATGAYRFPKKTGIQIAVDAFTKFLEEHDMEIMLVVFEKESVKISGELVEEVASFVDDNYVRETVQEEYKRDASVRAVFSSATVLPVSRKGLFRNRKRREGMGTESYKDAASEDQNFLSSPGASEQGKNIEPELLEELQSAPEETFGKTEEDLEGALKEIYTESFEKHLQKLINKKGFKNSEVYAAANISKQYFSKLLNGKVKPSKEKMLALAVGLRLNLDETVDFLRIAGYALSPISQTDIIVEYFIRKKDYNVLKIDIVLFDYGQDPLSKA